MRFKNGKCEGGWRELGMSIFSLMKIYDWSRTEQVICFIENLDKDYFCRSSVMEVLQTRKNASFQFLNSGKS